MRTFDSPDRPYTLASFLTDLQKEKVTDENALRNISTAYKLYSLTGRLPLNPIAGIYDGCQQSRGRLSPGPHGAIRNGATAVLQKESGISGISARSFSSLSLPPSLRRFRVFIGPAFGAGRQCPPPRGTSPGTPRYLPVSQ